MVDRNPGSEKNQGDTVVKKPHLYDESVEVVNFGYEVPEEDVSGILMWVAAGGVAVTVLIAGLALLFWRWTR